MTSTATAHATRPAVIAAAVSRATLPASDLARAREFYEETLGFEPYEVTEAGVEYQTGQSTRFLVFPSSGKASGSHTQMGWQVESVEDAVADLRARGIVLESYDMPGFDRSTGIASIGTDRSAWFHDSEGNLLGVFERM